MGPDPPRAAALVISECQMGILDPATSMLPALAPQPADHVSRRALGLTAFYGTDLDATLRLRSVETIVLTGVSTDVAIPGFALEAVNRGYYVRIPADCVAGTSAESYEFMMGGLLPVVARITDSATVLGQVRNGMHVREGNVHEPTRLPRAARGDGGLRRVLDRRFRR